MERSVRHLEEMAIFAKVGELGSISGAARALRLPKSSVSRAVSKLEAAFAARLVERTTRRVTLTEIGRSLHGHCLKMVSEAENAEAEIAAYQGHPSGRLRVSSPSSIGHVILKANLPEFLERYPEVDLQLLLTDRVINPVTDDMDVVIRTGWLEDSSLIARKIVDVNAILVASPAYLERHGVPGSVQDLSSHNVLGLPIGETRSLRLTDGKEQVEVPVWPRFSCNDPLTNMEFADRGLAIAPISSIVAARRVLSGELVHVLPKYRLADQPSVYALYAGRTALSPKISVFLDFLTELARRAAADPELITV
jgi:DNA-binding transcriptional LysR family regulator